MSNKKINHRLERLIDRLSIKDGKERFVKQQVKLFFGNLSNIEFNNFFLFQYWNGGSFSRGIALKKRFDIDIYFIFRNRTFNGLFNQQSIYGAVLFNMMLDYLEAFSDDYPGEVTFLREPPYSHAIPIKLHLGKQSLTIDCIPAIEDESEGYLIIPDSKDSAKKVNRNIEQKALSKLNKLHDGKVTKLILLIKYWKITKNRHIKSYLIERLAEQIFKDIQINDWQKGLKTFFNQALYILKNDILIPDRVYNQYSILHEYSDDQIDIFYKELKEGSQKASKNEWNKLFGNF